MPAVVFPRRATSTATTIAVTAAPATALQAAVQTVGFDSNEYFAFTGNALSTRVAHPVFTARSVDPTEDGQLDAGKTAIDWCGKGCYDSQGKRVMWAGTGAEGGVADTPYNTMALYDEQSNTWTAVRAWTAGSETSSDNGTGHTYDSNAIDVTGRRFFKRKFASDEIYVRNLTTDAWTKLAITGAPAHYGDCGMDYIVPLDRLWIRTRLTATNQPAILEINPSTGASTTILTAGSLGANEYPAVCSFNPRAFANAGGAFVGGANAATVRVTDLTIQTNTTGKPSGSGGFTWWESPSARLQHVCRDPVGDGWLYANPIDGYMWRLTSGGTWSQRAQLPATLRTALANSVFDFVMVPIDAYGVVWIVMNQGWGAERAWLYKP